MASENQVTIDSDDRLAKVIEDYLDARDQGERPDPREWIARDPELANGLEEFFACQENCLGLIKPLRSIVGSRPQFSFGDGTSFGDYELLEVIGRGGMGIVYKARQLSLDRIVALKMILAGQFASPENVQRFRKEARAAAGLKHPNIVAIHEVGEYCGVDYFCMDFIEGDTLASLVRDNPLDSRQAAEYVKSIAEAVQYSHEHRIIHRDLKPSNVLVDEAGQLHVTDFGLARWTTEASELTATGLLVGTPSYMSPEQARGSRESSTESDVYSLGAVLYELLVGRPPFRAATPLETVRQVLEIEPPGLRYLDRSIPLDIETICLKCLEKVPERRYQTAALLADDLGRFLRHEPILARPVGPLEKALRWCQRNKAMAGLVVTSVLAMIAVFGWGARELYVRRQAKEQLSESLVVGAEAFAQRGNWRAALTNLGRADELGHPDPVRVGLARIRALIALNSSEYATELDSLSERKDLGDHAAEVNLLQGMSLSVSGEQKAAMDSLQRARSLATLSPADAAIADAMLSESSPEFIRNLELAVELDPLSPFAQSYLVSGLIISGRFEDAVRRAEVAAALFPESPTYPMALAAIAALTGDERKVDQYLKMRGCEQLSPEARDSFRRMLIAIARSFDFIASGFDFDMTPEEFEKLRQATQERYASDLYPPVLQSMQFFGVQPDSPPETMIKRIGDVGIPCITRAYQPWHDALSLRTFGFMMTGRGNTKRIDELIERCDASSRIHPDGLFQCVRGRLLYARGRLDEAAAAYALAASLPCSMPVLRKDAFAHAARCYFELYQKGQADALSNAARFVKKRLEMGPVGSPQAEFLSKIALIAGDYDSARRLIEQLDAVKDESWIAVRRAEIDLADGNYLEAVNHARQIPKGYELFEDASRIKAESLKSAAESAKAVAEAVK